VARADNDLTDAEWSSLVAAWGGCAYCAAEVDALQRDCVLPISRGGRYTLANVVPACRSCNASKCNSEVTGWMRRKRLDERTFLVRHHEIVSSLTAPDPVLSDHADATRPGPTRSPR
jgi:5-methylcytosine-specific restriction endonuclease McrA